MQGEPEAELTRGMQEVSEEEAFDMQILDTLSHTSVITNPDITETEFQEGSPEQEVIIKYSCDVIDFLG